VHGGWRLGAWLLVSALLVAYGENLTGRPRRIESPRALGPAN
jgi:hypothetical protein